jgi:hypothetical protein
MAAALCYGVRGGGAQLAFHVTPGNYDTDRLIEVLGELRKFLGGEKATLLWDGPPAHRSTTMHAWPQTTPLAGGAPARLRAGAGWPHGVRPGPRSAVMRRPRGRLGRSISTTHSPWSTRKPVSPVP